MPWDDFIPEDVIGNSWRANSYKKAIARKGDIVDHLMDQYSDGKTIFLIIGDHGHVPPGGAGGTSDDVRTVPFFAYKKGSGMGDRWRQARKDSGSTVADSSRFVARARRIDEFNEPPDVTPKYAAIALVPSYAIARILRGTYMYKYRFVEPAYDEPRGRLPPCCSPYRVWKFLRAFFGTTART